MLSIHCLPQLISELPIPFRGLSAPPEEGLILHSNEFPGAFSKGAKGAWGWGCLKVKVATDAFFPLVNSIFILPPHHLRLCTWNPLNGGGGVSSLPLPE